MNDLEKMSVMSKKNMDIRMFPSQNIKRFNTGKDGYGELVMAVNNETLIEMVADEKKFLVGLYIVNKEQFDGLTVQT